MKLELSTERMQKLLTLMSKFVGKPTKECTSAYNSLQIFIQDNKLSLACLNGEQGIRCVYGEQTADAMSVAIDYWSFSAVVHSIEVDTITLSFGETKLTLTAGKSRYSFTYNTAEYNSMFTYTLPSKPILSIAFEELGRIYAALSAFAAQGSGQIALQGILYDGKFVATDGSTLALYQSQTPSTIDAGIMISKITYDAWLQCPDKSAVMHFYTNNNLIMCKVESVLGEIEGFSQLMVNKFPAYENALKKTESLPHVFELSRVAFAKAVKRLIPLSDKDDLSKVTLRFSPEVLTLECSSVGNTKDGSEEIPFISNNFGGPCDVMLNLKRVSEMLSASKEETIKIICDATAVKMLRFVLNPNLTIIQMPLKSK